MDIQEIFNTVISGAYYCKHFEERMCFSLSDAAKDGVISHEEKEIGYQAIEQYLDSTFCMLLETALSNRNLPHTFEDRLAIYRNWANRPELTEE